MFQLNPHDLPQAWWQHLLMLLVAGIIGYIIAFRNGSSLIADLEERLYGLTHDLEMCRKGLVTVDVPLAKTGRVTDDFKIIEGIGPQIEKLLHRAGILSYHELGNVSPDLLKEILLRGGERFYAHDPATWPRQAILAGAGKWEELKKWQEVLDGGRE
ncbi:hypothetical protein DYBT9275_05256 [Dyadobacter sp. CECT 9275]|uniref:DUF4332 domain-containing protein n=1 Tax=Dyadobacter helix TaxID=2822344 RepID=A0A916JI65_9BACT|nr:hypothetical protein [Dyadobacter sp. CECT 9275]CAG5012830.1 hypothetical protein DYBT9275_05256 [Dyadobacter sp. CECT 9275]